MEYITGNVFVDIGENQNKSLSLSLSQIALFFCPTFLLLIEPRRN